MRRSLFAEIRIRRRSHGGRDPHAPLFVEHRIVDIVLAGPDGLVAPVRRRRRHLRRRGRRARIAHGQLHLADRVADRIENGQVVGAELQRSVDEAVGVERGIPSVGRDLVVEIRLGVSPVPLRDDDVALESLRSRRRRRQLAFGDAIGPVGEHRQCAIFTHRVQTTGHLRAGLSRLNAPLPRFGGRVERAELFRDLTRPLGAKLVTRGAAARLHAPDPLGLTLDVGRNAVAARRVAREIPFLGHPYQRKPVAGRIVFRGRAWIRRDNRRQVHRLAGRHLYFGGVHQTVAAHPDGVARARKIGQQVAPAIVGDHDLDELRRKILRLRDDPDACLRPVCAGDEATDIVGVDGNRAAGRLTGVDRGLRRGQQQSDADRHRACVQPTHRLHIRAFRDFVAFVVTRQSAESARRTHR